MLVKMEFPYLILEMQTMNLNKEKVFYAYKIVDGLPKHVEKEVMKLIKDGWQPFGEMKTIKSNDGV